MEKHLSVLCLTSLALAISACTMPFQGAQDLQGMDPNEYYAEHPIKNKVETHQISQPVHFMAGLAKLPDDERDKLRDALRVVSPLAVDSIVVRLAQDDKYNKARK